MLSRESALHDKYLDDASIETFIVMYFYKRSAVPSCENAINMNVSGRHPQKAVLDALLSGDLR